MVVQYLESERLLTDEDYKQAHQTLQGFTEVSVLSMREKCPADLKHVIIGNFITRGMRCLESIYLLWKNRQYQDCWALHRTLADRLFHLYDLIETGDFEEFERWSFQRQYRDAERNLSNPAIRKGLPSSVLHAAIEQHGGHKERYSKEAKSKWRRPKAEDVAKRANLPLIYPIAFDTPSALVHPMADDGQAEFLELTGQKSDSFEPTYQIIHNSLIVQYFLLCKGIEACDAVWRGFITDFLKHWLSFMETGKEEHLAKAVISQSYDPSKVSWCEYSPLHDLE